MLKNWLKISRKSAILIVSVVTISAISFLIAYLYYSGINKSEDPRVVATRFMLERHDNLMKSNQYDDADKVLDSVQGIFMSLPAYAHSFEPGILLNNRASVRVSKALYGNYDSVAKQLLLETASLFADSCIRYYSQWIAEYGTMPETEIELRTKPGFPANDPAFAGKNVNKIIRKRIKDLLMAQKEAPRRLSVAYTNRGIIQRHQYKTEAAVESYLQAMKLWKDNPAAQNNLNTLLGKPTKKRSLLKKIFPPDRNN